MSTWFKPLFTVGVTNTYYGAAPCTDFSFLVPSDTSRVLAGARLLARVDRGQLYVLFDADPVTGAPKVPLCGTVLRFGLQLVKLAFPNYTTLPFDPRTTPPLYRNQTTHGAFDAQPALVTLAPTALTVPLDSPRPVTVSLTNQQGQVVRSDTVADGRRSATSFDLEGLAPGPYTLQSVYPVANSSVLYYLDGELGRAGVFGFIEVTVDPSLYTAPPSFTIAFQARQEIIKYYVVASGYGAADFGKLAVSDAGFATDGRSQLLFTRVDAAAFAADDVPYSLVAPNRRDQAAIFKSQSPVSRSVAGRRRIQLTRNGDILIPNLPQPGTDQPIADRFVRLSNS